MVFLLFLVFSSSSASPHIDCFLDNQECEITADNLVHTFMGISAIDECRELCEAEVTCSAFTHYGTDSSPIHDACLLFSSCSETRPWPNCTTGSSQCQSIVRRPCSIQYSGDINPDNFVDLIGSVPNELSCKSKCFTNNDCHLYTYYDSQDNFQPHSCFLLTSSGLQEAVVPCEHCSTGPAQCKGNETCQAAVVTNGSGVQNFPFLAERSVTLTLVAAENDCFVELDTIAVGGGGDYEWRPARFACLQTALS